MTKTDHNINVYLKNKTNELNIILISRIIVLRIQYFKSAFIATVK